MEATIQMRRDTAAAWTAENPVLASGEIGMENDTGKTKIGNGYTDWQALPYMGAVESVNGQAGVVSLDAEDVGALTQLQADALYDATGEAATVADDLSAHAALTTAAHGGIVASSDSRLSDARTPTSHTHPWSEVTGKIKFQSHIPMGEGLSLIARFS